MKWILESNRPKHLFAGLAIAALFGIIATLVTAVAVEVKDKMHGGKFDLLDIVATMIGGALGVALHAAVLGTWFYKLV